MRSEFLKLPYDDEDNPLESAALHRIPKKRILSDLEAAKVECSMDISMAITYIAEYGLTE